MSQSTRITCSKGKTMFASVHTAAFAYRSVKSDGGLETVTRHLGLGLQAWRQRQHLAGLDDAALSDIGVTRKQALHEAARPIWDVPAHWLRRA